MAMNSGVSDTDFWSDPSCVQCRAQDILDNLDEYTEMVRQATNNGHAMQYARRALSVTDSARLLAEAVRVGVRKGLAEIRGVLLSPHECGKTVDRMQTSTILTSGSHTEPITGTSSTTTNSNGQ